MKANETKLQPILEGTKQYVVPLFQRAYSWDKKEWDVLWDDLVDLCEDNNSKNHFLGSIVTVPTVSVPEGVTKYLLIDGQQRLTTVFVILSLLRETARENGDTTLADEINQTMLVNPFKKGDDYFKLMPTQADRVSFKSLICREPVDDQSQLQKCYQFFERKLKQTSVGIPNLNRVITSRLLVVSIVLDRDDNPHLVFESLNAKGRPLTQADLIRNYFFMRIHVDKQDEIHIKYWAPMQDQLGDDLTEYIRHYLMRNGAMVKQGDVYFTLKDRVGQDEALLALQDIAAFAVHYQKLLRPSREQNSQISGSLARIKRLEVTTVYPFLLNCYDDYSKGKLTTEDFLKILQTIENFVIRRFVCNIPTNQLNKIFPQIYGQSLEKSSTLADGVRIVLQTRSYPKDAEFRTRLIESKLYGAGDRGRKTKLILETLESSYQHKEQVDFEDLSVEHVMPQTVTDWWQSNLGEDWLADHELCLHTLGNLTMTAYNPELSNDPFPKKQKRFASSHLELNRYFAHVPKWTRAEIEARSQALANLALSNWPYFGEEKSATAVVDIVTGKKPKALFFLRQRMTVETWRDVLIKTLNVMADLEPDSIPTLAEEYPRFVSSDSSRFRSGHKLSNGFYAETHLSARSIYRFCTQAIESIGFSADDWSVETE